jgi:hypothetical protein
MKSTTRKQITMILAGSFILAAGCSSKTKPTDQNFIAGLNAYYANHNDCLFSSALRFPYEVSPGSDAKQDKQRMEALMHAGLMKQPTEDKSIHVVVYSLTSAGERAGGRFCYGHREVTSIDNFTPPTKAANGILESHVTYRYKMMDVPVWAKTDEMLKAFPEMARALSGDSTGEINLQNAGVGWQVPN